MENAVAIALLPEDEVFTTIGESLTAGIANYIPIGSLADNEGSTLLIDYEIATLDFLISIVGHSIADTMESLEGKVRADAYGSVIGNHARINIRDHELAIGRIKGVAIRGGSFFKAEGSA